MSYETKALQCRIHQLPPYINGEIARLIVEAREQGQDVIDLSQVNPQLDPPPSAVEKLVQAALFAHNHRYSASQGIGRLRRSVCKWYQRRFGVDLDADAEVVATMGTKEGIAHLLLGLLFPGDGVILPNPSYPVHKAAVSIAGGKNISVPLYEPGVNPDFSTPLNAEAEGFFSRLKQVILESLPRVRVMILSFPHNPTTTVVEQSFFERLVSLALEYEVYLIHDLAYADICFDSYRAPSLLQVKEARRVCVECYSLSKAFGIAGWRVGFCVGNPSVVAALKKVKSYLDFGIFQPLQIAAIDVLERAEEISHESASVYSARRDVLVSGLGKLGWEVYAPKATVFLWVRMPEGLRYELAPGGGSLELCRAMIAKARVAVCPGVGFDEQADDYFRFAFVESEQRIRAALKNLSQLRRG